MSLCPHGYTAFFDCPLCECPGCGRPQDICNCHERELVYRTTDSTRLPAEFRQIDAAPPQFIRDFTTYELERAGRRGTLVDEIVGGVGLVLLLAGAFLALHLR